MISLEELGLTKEKLTNMLLEQLVDKFLEDASTLEKKFDETVKKHIEEEVTEIFDNRFEGITSNLFKEYLDNFRFTQTNKWGETKKPPMTVTEFLENRAGEYLGEKVNSDGLTEEQCRRKSRIFQPIGSRLMWAIDKYLESQLQDHLKRLLSEANSQIAEGLKTAINEQMKIVLSRLKISN